MHHGVEKYLVGALHGGEHIHAFHQVGHAHIVVAFGFLLAGTQQILVKLPVLVGRVVDVELYVIGVVGVRMYPDGILSALKHAAEDGCKRTGTELRVGNRQHVGFHRTVCHIPVEIFGTPFRVEPFLVERLRCRRHGHVGMGLDAFLEVFPHIEHDALMVPPVYIVFLGFF